MPRQRVPAADGALYVRLPAEAFETLHRASNALGVHKKDLIAGLVTKYLNPDSREGLSRMGFLSSPRRVTADAGEGGPTIGAYSFQPYDPPEVMNAEQAAQLLQVEEKVVEQMAQAGKLPGRKLGSAWRFSRAALLAWLAAPETAR